MSSITCEESFGLRLRELALIALSSWIQKPETCGFVWICWIPWRSWMTGVWTEAMICIPCCVSSFVAWRNQLTILQCVLKLRLNISEIFTSCGRSPTSRGARTWMRAACRGKIMMQLSFSSSSDICDMFSLISLISPPMFVQFAAFAALFHVEKLAICRFMIRSVRVLATSVDFENCFNSRSATWESPGRQPWQPTHGSNQSMAINTPSSRPPSQGSRPSLCAWHSWNAFRATQCPSKDRQKVSSSPDCHRLLTFS